MPLFAVRPSFRFLRCSDLFLFISFFLFRLLFRFQTAFPAGAVQDRFMAVQEKAVVRQNGLHEEFGLLPGHVDGLSADLAAQVKRVRAVRAAEEAVMIFAASLDGPALEKALLLQIRKVPVDRAPADSLRFEGRRGFSGREFLVRVRGQKIHEEIPLSGIVFRHLPLRIVFPVWD